MSITINIDTSRLKTINKSSVNIDKILSDYGDKIIVDRYKKKTKDNEQTII